VSPARRYFARRACNVARGSRLVTAARLVLPIAEFHNFREPSPAGAAMKPRLGSSAPSERAMAIIARQAMPLKFTAHFGRRNSIFAPESGVGGARKYCILLHNVE